MRVLATFCAALLMLAASACDAAINGVFYDPAFPGEGWVFDSQKDTVAGTWYTYEASGEPTFRTFLGTPTFSINGQTGEVDVDVAGSLFRTVNRSNTTNLGVFRAAYRRQGQTIAIAIQTPSGARNLVPFVYAYANQVDRFAGVWTCSTIASLGRTTDTFVLDPVTTTTSDGAVVKYLRTTSGDDGVLYQVDSAVQVFIDRSPWDRVYQVSGSGTGVDGVSALFSGEAQFGSTDPAICSSVAPSSGEAAAYIQANAISDLFKSLSHAKSLDAVWQRARQIPLLTRR